MAIIKQNTKNIANETAKQRVEDRLTLGKENGIEIPPMPAWKINALNQVGEATLNQVLDKLNKQNTVMVVRPTGFGKSFMLAGLTSSKTAAGSNKFKNCLYIYPTKVIKTDMVSTYGLSGEDNRACKLQNVTFITYSMLGALTKVAGLKLDKDSLTDEYLQEISEDDSAELENDTENFTKRLTIRKVGAENNIYDTSDITWYNNLIKGKAARFSKKQSEYKGLIADAEKIQKDAQVELDALIAKKSKAVKKIATLKSTIETSEQAILENKSKLSKINQSVISLKELMNKGDNTEKQIEMASFTDVEKWLSQFDLILIDEAHKTGSSSFVSLYQGILKNLIEAKNVKMVGATATPYRLDGVSLEQYIFGKNSRLKSIDINDCIKPNNWEYLDIDLNKIMQDDRVIDEGTTLEYLQSRGLFKEIDYVYAVHNKEAFINEAIQYINSNRQSGNSLTEECKDKLLKYIYTKTQSDTVENLINRRKENKVTAEERKLTSASKTILADELRKALNNDMTAADKEYYTYKCDIFKNENLKTAFLKRLNYKLTVEELDYLIEFVDSEDDLPSDIMEYISKKDNHLKDYEKKYIADKINSIPDISTLIGGTVTDRNRYGLRYMKFIIFFASSAELNNYISRDRQSKTMMGRWFEQAFPGYKVFEASLHTGKGTQGVTKIKAEDLGKFKPTEGVIDLIYCVDQLNMGYHVDNITGVILMRNTESASVYNQQIGRCCSVRAENNTVMIDIVDKKPISEIINTFNTEQSFGLDKDGKQKDLKYLLNAECINICDLSESVVSLISNMRDMDFTKIETVKFLYGERHADAKTIKHMTKFSKEVITEGVKQYIEEQKLLNNIKGNKIEEDNKDGNL